MAYRCHPPGIGMSLRESERLLANEERRLAEQRRIAESEIALEKAQEETAELQTKVVRWIPIVAGGIALLIGGIVFLRKRKKGG